ncbi:hypothetical protein BT69DRAFT_1299548 [Atractiella rhizophila]|nr:hypothetical protein BT69DRAFT_1299548 [Atractiella rhizophila]
MSLHDALPYASASEPEPARRTERKCRKRGKFLAAAELDISHSGNFLPRASCRGRERVRGECTTSGVVPHREKERGKTEREMRLRLLENVEEGATTLPREPFTTPPPAKELPPLVALLYRKSFITPRRHTSSKINTSLNPAIQKRKYIPPILAFDSRYFPVGFVVRDEVSLSVKYPTLLMRLELGGMSVYK